MNKYIILFCFRLKRLGDHASNTFVDDATATVAVPAAAMDVHHRRNTTTQTTQKPSKMIPINLLSFIIIIIIMYEYIYYVNKPCKFKYQIEFSA